MKRPYDPELFNWRCDYCRKLAYAARNAARRAAKLNPGQGLSTYLCPYAPAGVAPIWHVGHLPNDVRRGEKSRDEIYNREQP